MAGPSDQRSCSARHAGEITDPLTQPDCDRVELGALLVLLHGAVAPAGTVEATYRVWRHRERARAAFVADADEQQRRGASVKLYAYVNDEPEPPEHKETVRIWRDGERVRVEYHGGERDGYYAVADGPRWWFWDERMGARSNEDDLGVGSGVGEELQVMFNPTPLLGLLRFGVTGRSQVARRPAVTVNATPRARDPRHARASELNELGSGGEYYELQVDQQLGVLLSAAAIRGGQPFHKIATLAIRFDEPIPAATFVFAPPAGEKVRGTRDDHLVEHVTLTEAQRRAPFTVLMPDTVPST